MIEIGGADVVDGTGIQIGREHDADERGITAIARPKDGHARRIGAQSDQLGLVDPRGGQEERHAAVAGQPLALLRADDALSVAAALRTVRGLDGEGSPSRWGAERVYRYVRWFERFPDACDEAETPEMVEALAALEKQVRALRRRIAEAVG